MQERFGYEIEVLRSLVEDQIFEMKGSAGCGKPAHTISSVGHYQQCLGFAISDATIVRLSAFCALRIYFDLIEAFHRGVSVA